jgi:hypothetical protein
MTPQTFVQHGEYGRHHISGRWVVKLPSNSVGIRLRLFRYGARRRQTSPFPLTPLVCPCFECASSSVRRWADRSSKSAAGKSRQDADVAPGPREVGIRCEHWQIVPDHGIQIAFDSHGHPDPQTSSSINTPGLVFGRISQKVAPAPMAVYEGVKEFRVRDAAPLLSQEGWDIHRRRARGGSEAKPCCIAALELPLASSKNPIHSQLL